MLDIRPLTLISASSNPFRFISSSGYTSFILPKSSLPFAATSNCISLIGVANVVEMLKALPAITKLSGATFTTVWSIEPPGFDTFAAMFILSTPAGSMGYWNIAFLTSISTPNCGTILSPMRLPLTNAATATSPSVFKPSKSSVYIAGTSDRISLKPIWLLLSLRSISIPSSVKATHPSTAALMAFNCRTFSLSVNLLFSRSASTFMSAEILALFRKGTPSILNVKASIAVSSPSIVRALPKSPEHSASIFSMLAYILA